MPVCKDCKHYEEIDENRGNCFGHEVPPDRDTSECPANAFSPKEKE